jgi:hypothetical protein
MLIHNMGLQFFISGAEYRRLTLRKDSIPVITRATTWVCGRSLAGIVSSNPAGRMDVCRECCVSSGGDLCVGLIPRPEESYRLWWVQ